jgi:hypothetical protein
LDVAGARSSWALDISGIQIKLNFGFWGPNWIGLGQLGNWASLVYIEFEPFGLWVYKEFEPKPIFFVFPKLPLNFLEFSSC